MDGPCNYHMFQRLMEDKEKWTQVQDPTSDGYFKYHGMLYELICFAERLCGLKQMFTLLTEKCLEPLKRRSSAAYAEAYSNFYLQILSAGIQAFGDNFEQSVPVDVNFVPMMHPTEEGAVFIAEKATFGTLMGFLQTEFYRGFAMGECATPLPQLRTVLPADVWVQHLLLQQHHTRRDRAYLS